MQDGLSRSKKAGCFVSGLFEPDAAGLKGDRDASRICLRVKHFAAFAGFPFRGAASDAASPRGIMSLDAGGDIP